MKPLILVIDDDVRHCRLYSETLRQAGFDVKTASCVVEAVGIMKDSLPAMVVSDVRMPGIDGITFLRQIKQKHPDLPCLLITAFPEARDAVKALKLGAVDYLEKPIDLDELAAAVSDALNIPAKKSGEDIPPEKRSGIIAESPVMRSILRDAFRVAQSDAGVLITGESGTGKEVIANFIHSCGARSPFPFVTLNCAAIPSNLLASELFGHQKGAFTGAVGTRSGRFREAERGTLFLDEIGDMPLDLQPLILRAIETGKIFPVGSDKEVEVDFRLITATNKDLWKEVKSGNFREDLYYRLNVIAFELPPLRERREDILPLAHHFLSKNRDKMKRLSPGAAEIIQIYSWPGNVRELINALQRASILTNTEIILPEHLPASVRMLRESVEAGRDYAGTVEPSVKTIHQAEIEAIKLALERTGGNRTKAAQLLGISRRSLIYKLKYILK